MSTTLPPLVLRFDVDDKGSVKYSRIQKGMDGVNKGMDRQSKQMDSLSKKWGGFHRQLTQFIPLLGTLASALTLREAIRSTMELASNLDEIGKTANALGVTTKALSEYQFAANLAGIETSSFNNALQRMQRFTASATIESGRTVEVLKKLNIELSDFRAATVEEQLELMADGFQDLQTQADRALVVTEIFGRSGVEMVNFLQDGSEGLRAMRQEAERFGASIDVELAQKAALFNDALLRMQTSFKALRRDALSQFLVPASIEMTLMAESLGRVRNNSDGFGDALGIAHDTIAGIPDELFIIQKRLEGLGISVDEFFRNPFLAAVGSIIERNNTMFALLTAHLRFAKQEIAALVPGEKEERTWTGFFTGIRSAIEDTTGLGEFRRGVFGLSEADISGQLRVMNTVQKERKTLVDLVNEEKRAVEETGKRMRENAQRESQANLERLAGLAEEIRVMDKLSRDNMSNRRERRIQVEEDLIATGRLSEERQAQLAAAQRALALQDAEEEKARQLADAESNRLDMLNRINSALAQSADITARLMEQQATGDIHGGMRGAGGPLSGGMGAMSATFADMQARDRMRVALEEQARIQRQQREELEALGAHHSEIERAEAQHAQTMANIQTQIARQRVALLAGSVATAGQTLADFRRQTENDSMELAVAQKALAIGQATVNTYLAASAAMAHGAMLGPISAAAAASFITALGLANVAMIAATPINKYHEGGLVTGPGGGSFGGQSLRADEVPAILQVGEVVASREDVKRAGSGGGGPAMVGILPEKAIENFFNGPRGKRFFRVYGQEMGWAQ